LGQLKQNLRHLLIIESGFFDDVNNQLNLFFIYEFLHTVAIKELINNRPCTR